MNKIRLIIYRAIKHRSKNLCKNCSDEVRGTCCYVGIHLQEPDEAYCLTQCSEYLRSHCTFPKEKVKPSNTGEKWTVILTNHPCKFLDLKTYLCTIFNDRFKINRACRTIKEGIKLGVWHPKCLYVAKNRKYLKGRHKVYYEKIESKLCVLGKANYRLTNEMVHEKLYPYY